MINNVPLNNCPCMCTVSPFFPSEFFSLLPEAVLLSVVGVECRDYSSTVDRGARLHCCALTFRTFYK